MLKSMTKAAIASALIPALLTGCATALAPLANSILTRTPVAIWDAQVDANDDPPTVTWITQLPGKHSYIGPSLDRAEVISEGSFSNWRWNIVGSESIQQSYRAWSNSNEAVSSGNEEARGWNGGMQRLYRLSAYLLGTPPRAIQVRMLLIPKGESFDLRTTDPIDSNMTLTLAAPFVVESNDERSQDRSENFREAIAIVGSQLQHVDFAEGLTAGPTTGNVRAVKDAANSFCWRLAVRPALAAYTNAPLKVDGRTSNLQMTTAVLAANYAKHPEEKVALTLYSAALTVSGADAYLRYRGLEWPKTGRDIDGVNALLEYCKALIHDPNDITTQQVPVESVKADPFFKNLDAKGGHK